MAQDISQAGRAELRQALRRNRGLFWAIWIFSFFANALMLTGPLYMLQVYDRVLGSRSIETLLALSLLVLFLYGIMGLLDFARGRVLERAGLRFVSGLDRRVFDAVVKSGPGPAEKAGQSGFYNLDTLWKMISAPVALALFDLPWTPVFLIGIALFHPWLGALAVAGGAVLILVAVINQLLTRNPVQEASGALRQAETRRALVHEEAEMIRSLGLRAGTHERWQAARLEALRKQAVAGDLRGGFSTTTRTFRLLLQSAMLGLGAWLVLAEELTPGAMIAGSILLGRALAPVEQLVGQWPQLQQAGRSWDRLATLLGAVPVEAPRTELPHPEARLQVQKLVVVPPGATQAALRLVSFDLGPGQALGVIGPSGAGKSTLARALTGLWRPAGGKVRLGGAPLEQYDPDRLGQYIGYLPQRVQLFDGTIAENIARMTTRPDSQRVVAAAQMAGAHEMILKLPEGYDTRVSAHGGSLSGGQIQRIGLARALYCDPVILILDEPNSNLDNPGSEALNGAIRSLKKAGKSVLIMAHRPAAIQECDLLLMLEDGQRRAFGPRDEVLKEIVANHQAIRKSTGQGGMQ
ncbi:type I secretion system permease/ATPase [Shimia sp.]|uniref:type I secretion system permease/ATPase n=1 Tax=Shimia sp. TaxID=1954381 RepID=UPI0035619228